MLLLSKKTIANTLGGCLQKTQGELKGIYKGYLIIIRDSMEELQIEIQTRSENDPQNKALNAFLQEYRLSNRDILSALTYESTLTMYVKRASGKKNMADVLNQAIIPVIEHLSSNGYQSNCFDSYNPFERKVAPKSDLVTGLIGAFLGSLVGCIVWVLIYKAGYLAGFAGAITGILAMKGYEKFGKTLDVKGVVSSVIIMVVMIFLANKIAWTWEIFDVYTNDFGYNMTFFDAFLSSDAIIAESDLTRSYYGDLLIGYALTALCVTGNVVNAYRNAKS